MSHTKKRSATKSPSFTYLDNPRESKNEFPCKDINLSFNISYPYL